jgi:hypothetical protein
MLTVTRDLMLPTAITGSYPRPLWFDVSLGGRSFKSALGDSMFREQYMDAVACVINAQEAAGLDIVTDGDSRFDLAVGGKSWFFYPLERLGGIEGHRDTSRGWMQRHGLRPACVFRSRPWLWPRGPEPAHRLLQVRGAGGGRQHRAARAGATRGACARGRSASVLRRRRLALGVRRRPAPCAGCYLRMPILPAMST